MLISTPRPLRWARPIGLKPTESCSETAVAVVVCRVSPNLLRLVESENSATGWMLAMPTFKNWTRSIQIGWLFLAQLKLPASNHLAQFHFWQEPRPESTSPNLAITFVGCD